MFTVRLYCLFVCAWVRARICVCELERAKVWVYVLKMKWTLSHCSCSSAAATTLKKKSLACHKTLGDTRVRCDEAQSCQSQRIQFSQSSSSSFECFDSSCERFIIYLHFGVQLFSKVFLDIFNLILKISWNVTRLQKITEGFQLLTIKCMTRIWIENIENERTQPAP